MFWWKYFVCWVKIFSESSYGRFVLHTGAAIKPQTIKVKTEMGTRLRTVEIFFNMVWSKQEWVWKSLYTVRTLAGASFLSQVRKVLKLKRVPKLENILKRQEWTKAVFKTKSFLQRFAKECYCYCEIVRSSFWKTCNSEKLKVTGSQNPKHPEIDIYRWGQCDLTKTGVFKTKSFHPAPASRQGQRLAKRSVLKTKSFLPASGQGQRLARLGGVAEQNESGDY